MARNLTAERERIAALLRQLRTDRGIRQVDLATQLGEPQSYVSRYESAEQRIDLLELRAICEALGTTLGEFVRRLEEES